jgi:quinol monooxygenase YgiN
MLIRSKITAVVVFFVVTIILAVLLYINSHTLDIEASPELSRELVHKINGQPCGTAYFKCCDVEKDGKTALVSDVWESPNALGSYRTSVYYDADNKVITKVNTFQWFYEPTLYGFRRDSDSCLQYLN